MSKVSRGKPAPAPKAKPAAAPKAGKTESKGNAAKVHGTPKADNVKISQNQGKVHVEADRFVADQRQLDAAKSIGVKTGRGKDKVQIANVQGQEQNLKLKTGVGRDRVQIENSANVDIGTGRGKDRVEDNDSRDLDIRTGRGRDKAVLNRTQDSTLRMGKGRDHATLNDVNDVHVKSARTHVNTSETARNRGRAEASLAAQNARANLESKIATQKSAGELRTELGKDGTLQVRGGKGADNVTLSQQDGKISVRSGERELASFNANEVKSVDIRTGRGKDQVNLENIDAGKVKVRTGRGADEVNAVGSKNVNIRTGRGKDQVHSAQNENLRIRTGKGADAVTDTASQNLRAKTGRGRDQIQMTETLDSKVNGGKGKDLTTLTDVDNVKTRRTQVHAFTTPPPVAEPPPADKPEVKQPEVKQPEVHPNPPPVEPEVTNDTPATTSPPPEVVTDGSSPIENELDDEIPMVETDDEDSTGEVIDGSSDSGFTYGDALGSTPSYAEEGQQISAEVLQVSLGEAQASLPSSGASYGRDAVRQQTLATPLRAVPTQSIAPNRDVLPSADGNAEAIDSSFAIEGEN